MEELDLGMCPAQVFAGAEDRFAVLLPGAGYPPPAPLLWFAREILSSRRWTVLQVADGYRGGDQLAWVEARLAAAIDRAPAGARILIVAKSLSTLGLGMAAALGLPGIWLTPLVHHPEVITGLEAIAGTPTRLIGGGADPSWDLEVQNRYPHVSVVEIPGADHALQIPGDPRASLDALRRVVDEIDDFERHLPQGSGGGVTPPRFPGRR